MGRKQVRCHGSEERFDLLAEFIYQHFGDSVEYIADVAGGQGLLTRILRKRFNYAAEVIDPRGRTLKGVPSRRCEYTPDMASHYDLIVGLHADEATRAVVESSRLRPILLVPCCNFWDRTRKLGTKALVEEIEAYLAEQSIDYDIIEFAFKGPKNVGIITNRRGDSVQTGPKR